MFARVNILTIQESDYGTPSNGSCLISRYYPAGKAFRFTTAVCDMDEHNYLCYKPKTSSNCSGHPFINTGVNLILGSKVQCLFCFETSTTEGREGEEGGSANFKKSTQDLRPND